MDMNRKISRIWGRNTSTPPTPAITPLCTSERTHSGEWTASSPAAAHAPSCVTSASVPLDSAVPMGPKVTANISAITAKKMGKARYLWVTIRSMRSDREISCSCRR